MVGTSLSGATLRWELSDGRTFSTAELNLVFETAGTYQLTLTASLDGRSEEQSRAITVVDQETFSDVFQKDGKFTRLHKMEPHPDGFVAYGEYCHTANDNGSCRSIGYQLYWFDTDGTVRTTRSLGNVNFSFRPRALTVSRDGNVVIAYERTSLLSPEEPTILCLTRIGEVGDIIARGELESTWHLHPRALLEKTDGNFVVGGYARSPSTGDNRAGMYHFAADLTHLENVGFGELNQASRIERLLQTGPNEVLGLMTFDGRMKIANSLNNSVADIQATGYTAAALRALPNGNRVAVTTNGDRIKMTVMRPSGEVISNRSVATTDVFLYNGVVLGNGNLLVCGTKSFNGTQYGYTAELTPSAEIVWEKRRTRANARLRSIQPTDDCGMLAVGFIDPPAADNRNNEAYHIKLKPRGEY